MKMQHYEIKVNGRYFDDVYYPSRKTLAEVKAEFVEQCGTSNVKVTLKRY